MATNHLRSAHQTNSWENWHEDEIVAELHRHRADVAERFGCDLERVFEYYFSVRADSEIPPAQIRPVEPRTRDLDK